MTLTELMERFPRICAEFARAAVAEPAIAELHPNDWVFSPDPDGAVGYGITARHPGLFGHQLRWDGEAWVTEPCEPGRG